MSNHRIATRPRGLKRLDQTSKAVGGQKETFSLEFFRLVMFKTPMFLKLPQTQKLSSKMGKCRESGTHEKTNLQKCLHHRKSFFSWNSEFSSEDSTKNSTSRNQKRKNTFIPNQALGSPWPPGRHPQNPDIAWTRGKCVTMFSFMEVVWFFHTFSGKPQKYGFPQKKKSSNHPLSRANCSF